MAQLRSLKHEDYTVGWICALPLELIASKTMLDETYASLPQDDADHNSYILGRIGVFNIVMACLPAGETGNNSAAIVGAHMKYTFKKVKIGLLVGIGGGAPSTSHDIRLGDVVVSKPGPQNGGVVQFDFGKTIEEGHFIRTGSLDKPPRALLTALSVLQTKHATEPSMIQSYLDAMIPKLTPSLRLKYTYQGSENDQLYQAQYDHIGGPTCANCDPEKIVSRKPRESSAVVTHYGTIASANQVMRNGAARDRLAAEFGGLCFEMEAAGLMDDFRCIVIRGICDYADSHKNKKWQEYAAATAAAYAKEFLSVLPPGELAQINTDGFLDWISKTPFDDDHKNIDALQGTGQWLLQRKIYVDWKMSKAPSTFLLHGIAGVGKTTLVYLVIEDIKATLIAGEAIAYFYCKSGSTGPQEVIRCLIRQLVSQTPKSKAPPWLLKEFENSQSKGYEQRSDSAQEFWSLESCIKCTAELVRTVSGITTIIIDAVDECDDTEYFLDLLDQLRDKCQNMKLFLTSREDFGVVQRYTDTPNLLISSEDNKADIEKFVRTRLDESIQRKRLLRGKVDNELREHIVETLRSKAEGIFLLPKLQLQALETSSKHGPRMIRPADVREKLSQLPKDLTKIYEEFYERILMYGSETKNLTIKALKWLMCAQELLSKSLLCDAVSFQTTGEIADLTEDELLEMCQNLISINPRSNLVDFSHASVREYLETRFSQRDAHAMASETCLSYVHIRYSNHHDEEAKTYQKDGFPHYCTLYWPFHVAGSRAPNFNESVTKLLQKFLEPHNLQSPPYARWMRDIRPIIAGMKRAGLSRSEPNWSQTLGKALSEDANPIFGTFAFGFTEWAKKFANDTKGELTELRNEQGDSLMTIACGEGHTELVEFMFDKSPAHFSMPSEIRSNFLSAVFGGHLGVVKFLFEKHPFILSEHAVSTDIYMMLAAQKRHSDVLGFMLENGAISTNTAFHRTPLHVSASQGCTESVKQLLRRGAKVSAKLPDGMTALHMAATNGHTEVVALLIKGGADVLAKTTDNNTALHLAAANGHPSIVELLIDAGVEIMAKNIEGQSALSWAASNGRFRVVESMLRKIKREDALLDFDTAELCMNIVASPMLDTNIVVGHIPVMPPKSRRQRIGSANRATVDSDGRTPLMLAVLSGYEEISQLLIVQTPESVDVMDNHGFTALHYAAGRGSTTLLQCLLDHGADTAIVGASGYSAIESAASQGWVEAVRMLLEHSGQDALTSTQAMHMGKAWLFADPTETPQVKNVISDFCFRFGKRWVWKESERVLILEDIPPQEAQGLVQLAPRPQHGRRRNSN